MSINPQRAEATEDIGKKKILMTDIKKSERRWVRGICPELFGWVSGSADQCDSYCILTCIMSDCLATKRASVQGMPRASTPSKTAVSTLQQAPLMTPTLRCTLSHSATETNSTQPLSDLPDLTCHARNKRESPVQSDNAFLPSSGKHVCLKSSAVAPDFFKRNIYPFISEILLFKPYQHTLT